MKLGQTLIFFGIVFTIYGLINFYLFKRILSVIPASFKSATSIILIFIILSYIAGRVLENFWVSHISDFLVWLGAFWIAIMFYAFLLVVLIDLVRLLNHFLPFLPAALIKNPEKLKRTCALIVSVLVFIAVAGGFFNSKMIAEKKYTLAINKKAGKLKTLNIVMVSDLHLGTIIGNKFLEHVVSRINNLKPDIILFAGDVIDEDIKPVLKDNFGASLLKLKSKYGVYAVTGNHEYIGGINDAVNYLREHGITMVRDEALLIDSSFYLVGREDRDSRRFTNYVRKELSQLVSEIDKSMPVILMDHQPFKLDEALQNGVDLQLSGHTHYGQLWPANYLIDKVYELSWGYKKEGSTHYYISCGVGLWGPPVRTGSRPEIVNIRLLFN